MVTATVEEAGSTYANALADLDVVSIAAGAGLTVGGFLLAQEFTDLVMPMLDFPLEPEAPMELAASAVAKVAGAVLLAFLALRGGDAVLAVGGGLAIGMLGSAGLDVFDLFQRGGVPGSSPAPTPSPSKQGTPSISQPPSPSGAVRRATPATAGGSFRGT